MALFLSPLPCGAEAAGARLSALSADFNTLNSAVRDNRISKAEAKEQLGTLLGDIRKEYFAVGGKRYGPDEWVFPLEGYGYGAIGGTRGDEYQPGGYDYFDGNRHGGHPSLDIFIHDARQRSLDDASNGPVRVLSVTGGVVVALEREWHSSSSLRGGKYLWIYDPTADALLYYAHNSALFVQIGDLVRPGDVIATVGRTGLNAHKRRSPTHLHLTFLALSKGLPVPRNIYQELLRSTLR
jgi:hypothetical protein